jgi:hypothetical protein
MTKPTQTAAPAKALRVFSRSPLSLAATHIRLDEAKDLIAASIAHCPVGELLDTPWSCRR